MKNRGFTLIELLVVISIISLLSSVILASLSVAREKGRIASGILFAGHNYQAFGADAIGYWNFDEGSGDLNSSLPAQDLSGNNRILTTAGATAVSRTNNTPVGSGYALQFSKGTSNGYVQATGLSGTDLQPSAITVSAWVNFNSFNNSNGALINVAGSQNNDNNPLVLYLWGSGNILKCQSSIGVGIVNTVQIVTALADNKWHHVACSRSSAAAGISTYYDGKQVPQNSTGGNLASAIDFISIGAGWSSSQNAPVFLGYIDDVAVYSSALTASQIQEIYAEQAPKHQYAANVK